MKKKKFIICLLISVIIFISTCVLVIKIYDNNLLKTYNNIAGTLIYKYPEDEVEIINIITKENENNYLTKYGIDKAIDIPDIKNINITIILIISVCFILIFLVIFLLYFSEKRKLKKEIKEINNYLQDILQGVYEVNIASYQEDELSILKNDIYKVTIKLKELSEYEHQEHLFLMNTLEDISHQLKTPLTALKITNDILLDNTLKEKERQDFLMKQSHELEKIEWLITTLLNISKLDSGSVNLKNETIKASDLVNSALESLLIAFELKNVNLIIENLNFNITCDIAWTKEALINILKNAYEHITNKGTIKITGDNNPLNSSISIYDNGCGISKKDIKNIFKRFYSTNNSKNSIGIGLNMASVIMKKQKGKIEVESIEGEYTLFKVIFPKN